MNPTEDKCNYCARPQNEQMSLLIYRDGINPDTLKTVRYFRLKLPVCSVCYNKTLSGQSPSTGHSPARLVMDASIKLVTGLRRKLSRHNLSVAAECRDRLGHISEQYDAVWLSVQQRIDFLSTAPAPAKRHGRVGIANDVRMLNAASRNLFIARDRISKVIEIEYDEARRAANAFIRREWVRGHVFRRAKWKCECCGGEPSEIDHIVPVIRGGENTLENLQALCKPCNASKAHKDPCPRVKSGARTP